MLLRRRRSIPEPVLTMEQRSWVAEIEAGLAFDGTQMLPGNWRFAMIDMHGQQSVLGWVRTPDDWMQGGREQLRDLVGNVITRDQSSGWRTLSIRTRIKE